MDDAARLKRVTHIDQSIMEHLRPDNPSQESWVQDEYAYYHRKYYDIERSILMCALPQGCDIENKLRSQIERAKESEFVVELLIHDDNDETSIAEKRNHLVQRAKGCFTCFVEEDDEVATHYLDTIRDALYQVPDADVVELRGVYVANGQCDRPFQHSRVHQNHWEDQRGLF